MMELPGREPSKLEREERAQKVIARHEKMKTVKQPWLNTWQLVSEYVMTRKQNFTQDLTPGEFLTGKLFDSTAVSSNHMMASSFIGQLYPNGGKTFQIKPPPSMSKKLAESDDVKEFYNEVTRRVVRVFDNSKCGFITSYEEYMTDLGAFGTAGIGVFEDQSNEDAPVRFVAVDVKKACIDEGVNGFVDTIYIERELSVRQLVQEFGIDTISSKSREAYTEGRLEEKVRVLHAIEPRMDARVVGGFGNQDFPVASIHIEIVAQHILKESGYHETPVFFSRFWKTMNEIYGRSPAMECMPDILEANVLREALIVATEKVLDPPLIVTDDGTLGGGVINTSAGSISVRRVSGRMGDLNHKAIEPMFTVGELATAEKRVIQLERIIQANFFIDKLTDLNNDSRMTLGEANIRNELRGQSLGIVYSRQIAEMLTPLVERVVHILLEHGLLGVPANSPEAYDAQQNGEEVLVIPDAVLRLMIGGKDAYSVVFTSPATRVMRAAELAGIKQSFMFAAEIAPLSPGVMDNFDVDQTARLVADLTGCPLEAVASLETMQKLREGRAQAQQAAQAEQSRLVAAQAGQATGKGLHEASKAGVPPEQFIGAMQPQQ